MSNHFFFFFSSDQYFLLEQQFLVFCWYLIQKVNFYSLWVTAIISNKLTFFILCIYYLMKVCETERRSAEDGGWQDSSWPQRTPPPSGWTSAASCLLAGPLRLYRRSGSRLLLTSATLSPQTPQSTYLYGLPSLMMLRAAHHQTTTTWTSDGLMVLICLSIMLYHIMDAGVS